MQAVAGCKLMSGAVPLSEAVERGVPLEEAQAGLVVAVVQFKLVPVTGMVVNLVLQLGYGVFVASIEESDQPLDFRGCLFPESGEALETRFPLPL